MAVARTPRSSWIEQGLRALAEGGPDAVRVESLAQALGVSKGGFYWHFDGRRALLEEMLGRWERLMVDQVIERIEEAGGDAREKVRRLFALASPGYGPERTPGLMEVELAVRDWARREPAVAARLEQVDNRRMNYMRALFADFCSDEADVEVRCLLAFSVFIGNYFIAATHARRSRAEVVELALERLIA